MRRYVVLLVAAALAACSDSRSCAPMAPCYTVRAEANAVAGGWRGLEQWRGVSIDMWLAAKDTTLSGTASWGSAVAGSFTRGTGTISGYVFGADSGAAPSGYVIPPHPAVVLTFAFSDGTSARLDQAVLRGRDTLSGALTFSDAPSTSYGATFVRASFADDRLPR